MTNTPFTAIYANGVLRPEQPLPLPEGMRVQIVILPSVPGTTSDESTVDNRSMEEFMAELEAMPLEVDDAGFSGVDHDRVLYGENGPR